MKIGFTGTQQGMTEKQKIELRLFLVDKKPSAFMHGGCIGADTEADLIAAELGITRIIFPSNIIEKMTSRDTFLRDPKRQGSGFIWMTSTAPLKRNLHIINSVDLIVGCPKTKEMVIRSGTWMTIRHGRRILGVSKVKVINP